MKIGKTVTSIMVLIVSDFLATSQSTLKISWSLDCSLIVGMMMKICVIKVRSN